MLGTLVRDGRALLYVLVSDEWSERIAVAVNKIP